MMVARLKREVAELRMERDILKNDLKGVSFPCDGRNLFGYTSYGRRGRLLCTRHLFMSQKRG